MLEFGDVTVKFITNRGVTHEEVRHRLASYAQESTRYVDYNGGEIQFIRPVWLSDSMLGEWRDYQDVKDNNVEYDEALWLESCIDSQENYEKLRDCGWRPEQARDVLNNALKTEIVHKSNVREWRHILNLRGSKKAHPQMKALMLPLLDELKRRHPVLFGDIHA